MPEEKQTSKKCHTCGGIQTPENTEVTYHDVKLRRTPETLSDFLMMTIFSLILPLIISLVLIFIIKPNLDLLWMLFLPMFMATLICILWFIAFMFIGGKFAKLSWHLFLNKRAGIVLRWFKSNQVEISVDKIDERVCFIPGDKLTEQTILEEKLAGSANFMGRPVALLIQDRGFNENALHEYPADPLSKDYNAAVQNSFDAGVFFNRVFEGNFLKYIFFICIFILIAVVFIGFFTNVASSNAILAASRVQDLNNNLGSIQHNQQMILEYLQQNSDVVFNNG